MPEYTGPHAVVVPHGTTVGEADEHGLSLERGQRLCGGLAATV